MKRKKRVVSVIFFVVMGLLPFVLTGCGAQEASGEAVRRLNDDPIDCAGATELTVFQEEGDWNELLRKSFSEKKEGRDGSTFYGVDVCRRNEESGFYSVSYGEDMAQFTFLNQIYRVDPETEHREMLYETREAYWLNEFEVNNNFLYWVEYVWTDSEQIRYGTLYRVMQYELATGEVSCIAERSDEEVFEICLAASERYVTWYDDYEDGRTEIAVYDIEKQELYTLPGVKKFSAFARLDIVDGGITYFSEDEEGNISVNRYVLDTKKTNVLLLGKAKDFEKPLNCFSTDRYLGWKTDCGAVRGDRYYFYDMENGALYSVCEEKGRNVFSHWLSDYLYLNCSDSDGDTLYVCELSSGRVWRQRLAGSGMQFRECEDGQVYLEVRTDKETELMTIEVLSQ